MGYEWGDHGIIYIYTIPSGYVKIANWKMVIYKVDIHSKHCDFHSYIKLFEGRMDVIGIKLTMYMHTVLDQLTVIIKWVIS